ncbi:MAG: hypothetical protein WD872_19365 [Pirellulaceae bacterium]
MNAAPDDASARKPAAKSKSPAWMGSKPAAKSRGAVSAWKPASQKQQDEESRRRLVRIFVTSSAVLLLLGFIAYLLFKPQATTLVVFRATTYPLQMPPLAFAKEDEALLARISPQNLQLQGGAGIPFDSKGSLEPLREQLKRAAGGRLNPFAWLQDAVIVYVAAHGVVNEQGAACLVPPQGDPFDSRTWLTLSDVLQAIAEEPALEGKKKLLVLDCQRVLSCWRSGLLNNRFAQALQASVAATDDDDLYVLTAAAADQVAWPAPELRGTVFGHFLARGLGGEARAGRGRSKTVTLGQLYAYLSKQVDGYVFHRRGVHQQPVLLHARQGQLTIDNKLLVGSNPQDRAPRDHDFAIAYVDLGAATADWKEARSEFDPLRHAQSLLEGPGKAPPASTAKQVSLQSVWDLLDQRQGYSVDPVLWASVQQRLAAIEERILAGEEYQTALPLHLQSLASDLNSQKWLPAGKRPRLSLASVAHRDSATDASQNALQLLAAWSQAGEPAKRRELLAKQASRTATIRDFYSLAASESGLPDKGLKSLTEILGQMPLDPGGELVESHFVTLLDRANGLADAPLTPDQVSSALAARKSAEQTALPADDRVHYAIQRLVNAADEKRRAAEDQLYLRDNAFAALVKQCLEGDAKTVGYAEIQQRSGELVEAYRFRDQVWSELPFLAEWNFLRWRLAEAGNAESKWLAIAPRELVELLRGTIALDDRLQVLADDREGGAVWLGKYEACRRAAGELKESWQRARAGLDAVNPRLPEVEDHYSLPADVFNVELAMRTPLLPPGTGKQMLGKYLATLQHWAEEPLAVELPEPAEPTLTAANTFTSGARPFLEELHRALYFEFGSLPYDQHTVATSWDDKQSADVVFRRPVGDGDQAWGRLRKLLLNYDAQMQKEPQPAWNATQSALDGSRELRRWDRRARLAAPWLCCFEPELTLAKGANHPTPSRWLQEYDAAHRISWHAYRLLQDFWGGGSTVSADSPPYFATAMARCEDSLGEAYRPLRYDLPEGGMVALSDLRTQAVQALAGWSPIGLPERLGFSGGAAGSQSFEVHLPPQGTAGQRSALFPAGLATLALSAKSAGSEPSVQVSFDAAGGQTLQGVALPLPAMSAPPLTAYLTRVGSTESTRSTVAAALWYRGHVVRSELRLGDLPSADYVESRVARREVSPPSIRIQGQDRVQGALAFVFDCSPSMRGGGRFEDAKRELQKVLKDLADDGADDLHIGLSAYARRTPGENAYYLYGKPWEDFPNNLSAGGKARLAANPDFALAFPHPDRDFEELIAVRDGSVSSVLDQLATMRSEDCKGVTPLYYSVQQAIRTAFVGLPRDLPGLNLFVISDGVNMPYDTFVNRAGGEVVGLGDVGRAVNHSDLEALEKALRDAPDNLRVTVLLFGTRNTPLERAQFAELANLDKAHANFVVIDRPDGKQISSDIRASFPKSSAELTEPDSQPQKLVLDTETRVAGWDQSGLPRRVAAPRVLRFKPAGQEAANEKRLELLGGEKIVLEFTGQRGERALRFLDDDGTGQLFEGPLDVVALAPSRQGRTIEAFSFKLRDKKHDQQFTPRPPYTWAEVQPAGDSPNLPRDVFPGLDAQWRDRTNMPVLEVPVLDWPAAATRASVRLWFRYRQPEQAAWATVRPGDSRPQLEFAGGVAQAAARWSVEQAGGEGEPSRIVRVTLNTGEPPGSFQELLAYAVWMWPQPNQTSRKYARDGSHAIHEFTFADAAHAQTDLKLQIVTKQQFQEGATACEFEQDIAN